MHFSALYFSVANQVISSTITLLILSISARYSRGMVIKVYWFDLTSLFRHSLIESLVWGRRELGGDETTDYISRARRGVAKQSSDITSIHLKPVLEICNAGGLCPVKALIKRENFSIHKFIHTEVLFQSPSIDSRCRAVRITAASVITPSISHVAGTLAKGYEIQV